jgi:hypothetical protein
LGRSDFVLEFAGQTWVIEMKISHKQDIDINKDKDLDLAKVAADQIKEKNYGGGYRNPVLLGLVVNDEKRAITAWAFPDQDPMRVIIKKPDTEQTKEPTQEQIKEPAPTKSEEENIPPPSPRLR